ncbi:hypothetical protein DFQ01_1612 [Paenibacillus cellulosilyticus]|uniref:Uncharacterized protein n=1 Tax=Paenibacillus cellulosilyticus TaxID=375489 RepID=A0A2V2Y8V2_9BACL|nr:hypothetical protein [Paenibacillus cellulosilyticus]PWV87368.1 hypothetical protein DFQ01_1612 [Paenibacillus cellulosilyticus]QKS44942.1 hypothetical protein HUB94_11360 [Paenibacillus cellulosilyticus]
MPDYDLYVLSSLRDRNSLNNFINRFSDRQSCEDLKDEELMILPHGISDDVSTNFDEYDWVPAVDISNVVEIGMKKPFKGFRFYLNSKEDYISKLILSFTTDGYVIYGLSIDSELKDVANLRNVLNDLFNDFQGISGGIFLEESAPLSSKRFLDMLDQSEERI